MSSYNKYLGYFIDETKVTYDITVASTSVSLSARSTHCLTQVNNRVNDTFAQMLTAKLCSI